MKRRDFLTLAGGAAAGITIGRVGLANVLPTPDDPSLPRLAGTGLEIEREALTVCGGCPAGCSALVRVVDSRIISIRGNPKCPLGMGGLCARGVSEVAAFYEPDRLMGPVARDGARGAGGWSRRSWDQALGEVATRINTLLADGHPARVGVVLSSGQGATAATAAYALGLLGSPHVYDVSLLRDQAALAASTLAVGEPRPFGYDLDRAEAVFAFGTPLLEGWLSPAYVARRFGRGRMAAKRRLRLIYIGSRLSPTAMRADEWIRCNPGTEPVVAMAMAAHMLREGLADADGLEELTGLAPFKDAQGHTYRGLARTLAYAYTPHAASQETGVPVVDILRLARVFAANRAPVAIGERTAGSSGMFGVAASQLLNALKRRIGAPGGVVFSEAPPVTPLTKSEPLGGRLDAPPFARVAGTPVWRVLAELQRAKQPPPFDVLIIEDGAALADVVPGDPAWDMLAKIPLVVSAATALDASAAVADIILPATTWFEQDVDVEIAPSGSFSAVAAARPVVPRLVDGRPLADVLLDLARRAGKKTAFKDISAVVEHRLSGLYLARRGLPYDTAHKQNWTGQMERAGWWTASHAKQADFLAAVYDGGGWLDPVVAQPVPTTAKPFAVHGGVHLHSAKAKASTLFAVAADEDNWLPRAELPAADDRPADSLLLDPFPVAVFSGRGTPNRPMLLQIAAPHVEGGFRPWVELNGADASERKISNGTIVRLESAFATLELEARVTEGVRPGTVAIPWAPAAVGYGRAAKSWGAGAERLAAGTASGALAVKLGAGLPVTVRRAGRQS